jgi:predicted ester cyclase
MPATGKLVKYTGIAIFRIANGKIVEQWQEASGILRVCTYVRPCSSL